VLNNPAIRGCTVVKNFVRDFKCRGTKEVPGLVSRKDETPAQVVRVLHPHDAFPSTVHEKPYRSLDMFPAATQKSYDSESGQVEAERLVGFTGPLAEQLAVLLLQPLIVSPEVLKLHQKLTVLAAQRHVLLVIVLEEGSLIQFPL
jgi:hypothetical protein